MFKQLLIIIFLSFCNQIIAQNDNSFAIKENKVKEVNGFLFETKTSKDSILISKNYFNSEGKNIKIEIFDSTESIINTYKNKYRFDTLKTIFLSYQKEELKIKTIYVYDKDNQKSRTTVYLNNQNEKYTTYIFNKEGKVIEVKKYKNNKLIFLVEFKYYSFGEIKEKIIKHPKHLRSVTKYRKTRAEIEQFSKTEKTFDNYKNSNKKMINTSIVFNRKTSYATIKGKMAFIKKDVLRTKAFYHTNGLLDYVLQYKNDILIAKKVNHYIY